MTVIWCILFTVSGILIFGAANDESHQSRMKRLTTFGKSPTVQTPAPEKTPRGKDCTSDTDCENIPYTTCIGDKRDGKLRCLCLGNEPPVNGECVNKRRELHSSCKHDYECIDGAECTVNSTYRANEHLCYCKEGYIEENNTCNGSIVCVGWLVLIIISLLVILTPERY